jgi:O-antigen biosynthesis protein WbqP
MPSPKRALDVATSFFGLVLLMPVLCVLGMVVMLSSPGPAIFRQTRLGRNERPFVCYKFRTMYEGTAQRATHEVGLSAITPVGSFLRKFKLDELPQLWNVLRGDMSLVGPRPCLSTQTELVGERRKRGVFAIPPGITGLAQIEGVDMSEPERLAELDETYMRDQSLGLDIGIIIRTIFRA